MNIGIKGCSGKVRCSGREMLTPNGILLGRTTELLVSTSTQAPVKDEKYKQVKFICQPGGHILIYFRGATFIEF